MGVHDPHRPRCRSDHSTLRGFGSPYSRASLRVRAARSICSRATRRSIRARNSSAMGHTSAFVIRVGKLTTSVSPCSTPSTRRRRGVPRLSSIRNVATRESTGPEATATGSGIAGSRIADRNAVGSRSPSDCGGEKSSSCDRLDGDRLGCALVVIANHASGECASQRVQASMSQAPCTVTR